MHPHRPQVVLPEVLASLGPAFGKFDQYSLERCLQTNSTGRLINPGLGERTKILQHRHTGGDEFGKEPLPTGLFASQVRRHHRTGRLVVDELFIQVETALEDRTPKCKQRTQFISKACTGKFWESKKYVGTKGHRAQIGWERSNLEGHILRREKTAALSSRVGKVFQHGSPHSSAVRDHDRSLGRFDRMDQSLDAFRSGTVLSSSDHRKFGLHRGQGPSESGYSKLFNEASGLHLVNTRIGSFQQSRDPIPGLVHRTVIDHLNSDRIPLLAQQ